MPATRAVTALSICTVLGMGAGDAALARDVGGRERGRDAVAASVRVGVDPPAFSPNGDGRVDQATITVEADAAANVRVDVVDTAGAVRRTWTLATSPGAPTTVVWDGRDEAGRVEDGPFTVRARGADPVDLVGEASTGVRVDTHPPSFRWRRPSFRHARTRMRLKTGDASMPVHISTEIAGDAGTVATIERRVEEKGGTLSIRTGRLYPGTYRATVRVVDALGNPRAAGPFPWRMERPMRGRVWRRVEGAGSRVALTIDDCHYEGAWASMLRTLADRRAGATFFCPGQTIRAHPELARRTIDGGHAIGSHGWDHAALTTQPDAAVERRLERDADALWGVARHTTAPFFRPPYGAYDRSVVAAAGRTSHPRVVLWDVDTGDWASPGVGTIVSRAVNQARPGSIILLHTTSQSAAALPAIISGLRERGLEPVGLPGLFAAGSGRP